jgi:hypothetical protein
MKVPRVVHLHVVADLVTDTTRWPKSWRQPHSLYPLQNPASPAKLQPISLRSLIYLVDVRSRFIVDFLPRPAPNFAVPRSTGYNLSSHVT